jgi:flagellar basal body-associated protein FliL
MSQLRKSRLIIIIVGIILLVAGGVVTLLYFGGVFSPGTETIEEVTVPSTGKEYQTALREKQAKVTELVAAGGEQSIQQADEIVAAELKTAEKSQNKDYIVEAKLVQATLQTETGRADDALQALLELEQRYAGDLENLYLIYAQISYAYLLLENNEKSNEYLEKIPGEGFDE